MKKALITGIAGQDGTYLSEYLLNKNYCVVGVDIREPLFRGAEVITNIDLTNHNSVFDLIKKVEPNEIYHLAAYHNSSEDEIADELETFKNSYEVNVLSVANILEAVRLFACNSKIFYAASSHIFGESEKLMQDENSTLNPNNIYGITKAAATKLCHYYRDNYNIFVSVGILYAHESPLRTSNFVSKKIVETAVSIKKGKCEKLVLGSLDAEADWGYAGDYVVAMHKILQNFQPDDFVISSGIKHSVKEFVQITFGYLGMDWEKFVIEDNSLLKGASRLSKLGDNQKLVSMTGWKPTVKFEKLVKIMVEAELEERKNEG